MELSLPALFFALLAGVTNLIGGLVVTLRRHWNRFSLLLLIAVGAGYMTAAAVLKMIPVSLTGTARAPLWILIGFTAVHLVEHTFTSHFHFGEETHTHAVGRMVGVSALVGLLLHTLFDGIAIGSGFLVEPTLGVLVSIAVVLHKLPEGVTIASIMLASGQSRGRALASAGAIGAATILGVLLMGVRSEFGPGALAFSAGVTLYVAASDLLPEINKEGRVGLALGFPLGIAIFFLSDIVLDGLMSS